MDSTDTTTPEPFDDLLADSGSLERCATCSSALDEPERWYPTCSRETEDGLALFAFCDTACREEFQE